MNSLYIIHDEDESTRRELVLACFTILSLLGGGAALEKAGNTFRLVHSVYFVSVFLVRWLAVG